MKSIFILVILTVSSIVTNSQTNDIFKRRPWNDTKLKWLLQDTLSRVNSVPNFLNKAPNVTEIIPLHTNNGVYKIPLHGVYVGDNGRGDEIYAMQPDKMPCLAPGKNFVSNMPVTGFEKLNKDDLPLLQKDEGKDREKE